MYENKDFKRLEPYLEYAFDKAHIVYPANAEALYNYSIDDEYVLVIWLKLNKFYLLKLIEKCNPKFNLEKNEQKVKSISMTYKTDSKKRITEIMLTPNQLIQLIDFVQGKGSQTNLF